MQTKKTISAIVKRLMLLIICIAPFMAKPSFAQTHPDRAALEALYYATGGPTTWTNRTGWLVGDPSNSWHGITMDPNNRVRYIDLTANGLTGEIPLQIADLTNLQRLILSANSLTGAIPQNIFLLPNLELINISNNQLSGPFSLPVTIPNSKLQTLILSTNRILSPIPDFISQLSNLRSLVLYDNQFYGNIPASIGTMIFLQDLRLYTNNLSGPIPPQLGDLRDLTNLALADNKLTGAIPEEIYNLTKLTTLSLFNNNLGGGISANIGNLKDLAFLALSNCGLSGPIPQEIGQLDKLQSFNVSNNQLSGSIPANMSTFTNLSRVIIENNNIENIPDLTNVKNQLACQNNFLDFGDLEPNASLRNKTGFTYTYNPQKKFGQAITITVVEGNFVTLDMPCGGTQNVYEWYKTPNPVPVGVNQTLQFPSVQKSNAGTYSLAVKNELYRNAGTYLITIQSNNITLVVLDHCLKPDSLMLVDFYNATGGTNWIRKDNWLTGPVKTWYGVVADSCNILSINLPNNNLTGTLLPTMGTLSKLGLLNLEGNAITGPIPKELGLLNNLTLLNLGKNQLNGTIPAEFGNLTNLEYLALDNNQLAGNIATGLGNLSKLQHLNLSANQLGGTIPVALANCQNLSYLNLGKNQLEGEIPVETGNLANLKSLILDNNKLSGSIPPALGNLSQLTILELQNNTFIGILPMELYQLTNLETLNLSFNQFYGNIDQSLGNLLNLKVLELSQNSFSGKLPYTIGNLTQLTRLMLHNNSFIADIPPAVGLMSELKVLQFQHNNFDEIPDLSSIDSVLICSMNKLTFEDFERNLELIRNTEATFSYAPQQKFNREYDTTAVEGNPFTLTIPCGGVYNHYKWFKDSVEIDWADDASSLFFAEIQLTDMGTYHITVTNDSVPNLELISFPVHLNVIEHCLKFDSLALVALYLATDGPNWTNKENWLVKGTRLNDWFGVETDSCNVLKVELASNNLKGTLPAEITELEMLSVLDLGKNGISGSLPTDIGLLSNLETLKINDNLISGNIPNTLWDLTKLKVLDLNNNVLTGSIASRIGQLVNLEYLDLGTNRYSGSIPREIGLLTNLRYLDISFTPLAGSLPNELGNLLLLQTLRLSNSNYSGVLPTGLTNLTKLDTLELQSNFFRGNIPSFSGNPSLDFMNVANNKYLFGDLHTATINLEKINYIYSPQDTILDIDYDFEMSTLNVIDDNFTGNIYSWYLNNIEMKTTGNPIVINEKGVYYCLVTNPAFPELTLETIKLEVDTVKLELVDLFPVNLVIIGSGYNPYFIVPGLERYPNNNFALFTKWGNLVYRKSGYANELDLSIYPAGTYYYVLTYTLREKHKQIKNFVDLIKK